MKKTKMPDFIFSKRYNSEEIKKWIDDNKKLKMSAILEVQENGDILNYICYVYCFYELRRAEFSDRIPKSINDIVDIRHDNDYLTIEFKYDWEYYEPGKMIAPIRGNTTHDTIPYNMIDEFCNGEPNKKILDKIDELTEIKWEVINYYKLDKEIQNIQKTLNKKLRLQNKCRNIFAEMFPELGDKIPTYKMIQEISKKLDKDINDLKIDYNQKINH